jgi:ABC-type transport system involved in Fe-S cluster assembly fused permease/ATPase subunit
MREDFLGTLHSLLSHFSPTNLLYYEVCVCVCVCVCMCVYVYVYVCVPTYIYKVTKIKRDPNFETHERNKTRIQLIIRL